MVADFSAELTVVLVLLVIACLPLVNALFRQNGARPETRERGTIAELRTLIGRCGLEITDHAHFLLAVKTMKQLMASEAHAISGSITRTPLTVAEMRYLNRLRRAVLSYEQARPWLMLSAADVTRLLDRIVEIEATCSMVERTIEQHSLKYAETRSLLSSARSRLARTRSFVKGELAPADDQLHVHSYEQEFEGLHDNLNKAAIRVDKASFFAVAEISGNIRYPVRVVYLIERAVNSPLNECVKLLEQALDQAENPDATADRNDLALVLHMLGRVTWLDLKDVDEAELIFLRAIMASAKASDLLRDNYGELARLYADDGRFDNAEKLFKYELHVAQQLGKPEQTAVRARIYLGNAYARAGRLQESIECLEQALRLCSDRALAMADYFKRDVLRSMTDVLCRQGNNDRAARLYDECRRLQAGRTGAFDSRERLIGLARMLEAVGRTNEARELVEKADSDEVRERDLLRQRPSNAVSIAWGHRRI